MDGHTDTKTDTPSYRDWETHLKTVREQHEQEAKLIQDGKKVGNGRRYELSYFATLLDQESGKTFIQFYASFDEVCLLLSLSLSLSFSLSLSLIFNVKEILTKNCNDFRRYDLHSSHFHFCVGFSDAFTI